MDANDLVIEQWRERRMSVQRSGEPERVSSAGSGAVRVEHGRAKEGWHGGEASFSGRNPGSSTRDGAPLATRDLGGSRCRRRRSGGG